MSSFVSKAGPESEWGSDSRIAAVRRWHEKSVASRHDQLVLLLDGADLRPGLRVLDLACGAGMPALAEARRVGPRGNVVGTDTSEAMLSLAREYAQAEGLTNVEFRAADAGALPFEDEAFDRVTSGFGAMYFPDLSRAIAESFRVLRPGGRLTWLAWGRSISRSSWRRLKSPCVTQESPSCRGRRHNRSASAAAESFNERYRPRDSRRCGRPRTKSSRHGPERRRRRVRSSTAGPRRSRGVFIA